MVVCPTESRVPRDNFSIACYAFNSRLACVVFDDVFIVHVDRRIFIRVFFLSFRYASYTRPGQNRKQYVNCIFVYDRVLNYIFNCTRPFVVCPSTFHTIPVVRVSIINEIMSLSLADLAK